MFLNLGVKGEIAKGADQELDDPHKFEFGLTISHHLCVDGFLSTHSFPAIQTIFESFILGVKYMGVARATHS